MAKKKESCSRDEKRSVVLLEDAKRAKYANIERRKRKAKKKETLARDFYAAVCACKI